MAKQSSAIDTIRFAYSGGLADSGRLNFYELGRAYYAASRLVFIVARFRESGRVLSKVTERVETTILAEAPQRGSFVFDAIAFLAPVALQAAVDVPISTLFAWVWEKILPTSRFERELEKAALLELSDRNQKTAITLSRHETERLKTIQQILDAKDRNISDLIQLQKLLIE